MSKTKAAVWSALLAVALVGCASEVPVAWCIELDGRAYDVVATRIMMRLPDHDDNGPGVVHAIIEGRYPDHTFMGEIEKYAKADLGPCKRGAP